LRTFTLFVVRSMFGDQEVFGNLSTIYGCRLNSWALPFLPLRPGTRPSRTWARSRWGSFQVAWPSQSVG